MARLRNRIRKADPHPIIPTEERVSRSSFGQRRRDAAKLRLMERDGHKCHYCGRTDGPFWLDHVFPVSRGGDHGDDNLVLACPRCNMRKFWAEVSR